MRAKLKNLSLRINDVVVNPSGVFRDIKYGIVLDSGFFDVSYKWLVYAPLEFWNSLEDQVPSYRRRVLNTYRFFRLRKLGLRCIEVFEDNVERYGLTIEDIDRGTKVVYVPFMTDIPRRAWKFCLNADLLILNRGAGRWLEILKPKDHIYVD